MADKLYFVAGEASGDAHGAALMRALRSRAPNLEFAGRGGPQMRHIAGEKVRDWIADAAVVGLWEVLKRYTFFHAEFSRTVSEVTSIRPAAVVLVDYPGFNLRLARTLRTKLPQTRIIYYISPQVWAWNARRIRQMAKWLDLVLCIFPFEPELYEAARLRAVFVGHPLAGSFGERCADQERDPTLVALFPGSREREVRKIFPIMRKAALALSRYSPQLRFAVGAASERLASLIRMELGAQEDSEKFSVTVGETRLLMQCAAAAIVASGTATLEATLARLPFVLVYRVNWLTYLAARMVVRVKYLGMPNVLAGKQIVPEFVQHKARPEEIALSVQQLLEDRAKRQRMLQEFETVAAALGSADASEQAAEAIMAELRRAK